MSTASSLPIPRPAQNPQIRLMEAVRYARLLGGTNRDIRELVEATLRERR